MRKFLSVPDGQFAPTSFNELTSDDIPAPLTAVVHRLATQALTTGVLASFSFDTEEIDNGSIYASGSPTRLTVALGSGQMIALVTAQAVFAANATGRRRMFLYKNGSPILTGPINIGASSLALDATSATFLSGSWMVPCVLGDYFEVRVDQTSGGNLNVQGSAQISIVEI